MTVHLKPVSGLLAAAWAAMPVALASFIGQLATRPNLEPWYASLTKPSFNPPNWIFAPVWTTLYVLMAISVWRVLRLPTDTPGRRSALILFFMQLAMNAAWSWMFFQAHDPLLGLINIVPQLVLIYLTLAAFSGIDKWAGLALVPLAAWVSFACILNFKIWELN